MEVGGENDKPGRFYRKGKMKDELYKISKNTSRTLAEGEKNRLYDQEDKKYTKAYVGENGREQKWSYLRSVLRGAW
jgi:hypothetical protein